MADPENYTPTDAEAREHFCFDEQSQAPMPLMLGQWDRWIAEHDRQVSAATLESFANRVHADTSIGPEWRPVGWANRLRQHAAAIRTTPTETTNGGSDE